MNGRSIRLFKQTSGEHFGLMPVPVLERPGRYKLEFLTKDGQVSESAEVSVRDAHFPTQNVALSKALTELHSSKEEIAELTAFHDTVSDVRYWTEPFEAPVPGFLTSPFGVKRLHNGKPTGDFHAGLDQRAPEGSPVRAITGGVVKLAQPFTVLGGTVGLDHGQGVESMYLHMSKIAATVGTRVEKGDILGYVGSTGRSTGPHLHWAIYVYDVAVNPSMWIKATTCASAPKKPFKAATHPMKTSTQ